VSQGGKAGDCGEQIAYKVEHPHQPPGSGFAKPFLHRRRKRGIRKAVQSESEDISSLYPTLSVRLNLDASRLGGRQSIERDVSYQVLVGSVNQAEPGAILEGNPVMRGRAEALEPASG